MGKFLSDQHANELPEIFNAVRDIIQPTRGRPIRRDRGGQGSGNPFGLCTITAEGANDQQFLVDVVLGNPNDAGPSVKGILYLNYATTNAIAIGGQLMAITYASSVENIVLDCFPIETLYNLVALPEVAP